jgi:hypothetical protein
MRKLVAIVALGAMLIAVLPVTAHAHGAALGLAAFAAFTALFALPLVAAAAAYPPYYAYPAPVYVTAPPAYYSPPVSYAPAPPVIQREVVYPHGRHVLYGDGIRTPYQWAWVPNPPAPPSGAVPPPPAGPPPPAPPGR